MRGGSRYGAFFWGVGPGWGPLLCRYKGRFEVYFKVDRGRLYKVIRSSSLPPTAAPTNTKRRFSGARKPSAENQAPEITKTTLFNDIFYKGSLLNFKFIGCYAYFCGANRRHTINFIIKQLRRILYRAASVNFLSFPLDGNYHYRTFEN